MKVTFLGTGASHGVPVIGCDCSVCKSSDEKNKRFRSAVFLECDDTKILIDTPPEFRLQAIRENITRADGLLFTHSHADHFFGLDDVRKFNEITGEDLNCYALDFVNNDICRAFDYIFRLAPEMCATPHLNLIDIHGNFFVKDTEVIPIPIKHGKMDILGYRIKNFAYLTDCSYISPESIELVKGIHTLVLGAFRYDFHPTHMTVDKALELSREINPQVTYFTHMSHRIDYYEILKQLPANVYPAYDGLKITIDDE